MTSPAQSASPTDSGATLPPGRIRIEHLTGDRYEIAVRGHRLVVDQPVEDGGQDAGPTPTELFAASLASCVAFYAGRYLVRHDVDPKGLRVDAGFTMATDRPARVSEVTLTVEPPKGLDPARYNALLAVASHCTVHNTLHRPPTVRIETTPSDGPE
ncbi:OsmC family protein [Kitasatospora purpeofusca]|uniref:OsmC family protein n=1 Tax=Kitasatospora purpeofusca TaxID=67352 RepID=UPI00225A7BE7|nr:OsmC family protein [Kitasatospora purpeofusca]MCX4757157.1 OsmC family protein [Kitasatospora purpeofusca]WSR35082.1 OsmC family protein [Kitasatospora purpeofusca]WSR43405.1 OsmC family protein [Kitasatospora purpeofusca]